MQEPMLHLQGLPLKITPRYFTTGAGAGVSAFELVSFDRALREAGFADYNLLRVSSILPPSAEHRSHVELPKGSLLPIAYGVFTSNERAPESPRRSPTPSPPTLAPWASLWRQKVI